MEGRDLQSDHPDSPMRKRQRLDGGADGDQPIETPPPPSDDTIDDHVGGTRHSVRNGQISAQNTPSKVTLNLRSPDSSPTAPRAHREPISDDPSTDSSAQHAQNTASTPDFIVEDQCASSDSGEAVEIEIDDPEDINPQWSNSISTVDQESDMFALANGTLQEFPSSGYRQSSAPLDKLEWFADAVTREVIHMGNITPVTDWIRDQWLDQLPQIQLVAYMVYVSEKKFWDRLSEVFRKLLVNRSLRNVKGILNSGQSPIGFLVRFFSPYVHLVGAMVDADLGSMEESSDTASTTPELVSSRYLACLTLLLRQGPLCSFWTFNEEALRVNADQAQRHIVLTSVLNNLALVSNLTKLCKIVFAQPSLASRFSVDLLNGIMLMKNIQNFVATESPEEESRVETGSQAMLLKRAAREIEQGAVELTNTIEDEQTKQLPQVQSDHLAKMIPILADIAGQASSEDLTKAQMFLQNFGPLDSDFKEVARMMASFCTSFGLHWALIRKGRMDLRVSSMQHLSTMLRLFYSNTERDVAVSEKARKYVADWLVKIKIVEYLSGADSHPQLISRSGDTLSFLLITGTWTTSMSESIWSCLLENPDPRICGAMWAALGSGSHYMSSTFLSDFCRRVTQLPSKNYPSEMLPCLDEMIKKFADRVYQGEYFGRDTAREDPLKALRTLVCNTAFGVQDGQDSKLSEALHHSSLQWLARMSDALDDRPARQSIYDACMDDLRHDSGNALGSLESVLALLGSHGAADLEDVVVNMGMFDVVAEEFCRYTTHLKQARPDSLSAYALSARLNLCMRLASCPRSSEGATDLEPRLLVHMVGREAINQDFRELSWAKLVEFTRHTHSRIPFIDDIVTDFIPNLAPEAFTHGTVEFLRMAVDYNTRFEPFETPTEDGIVNIPMTETVWRLFLCAPVDTLETEAIDFLCRLYLTHCFIQRATQTSVSTTHNAVIDRCVDELQRSAAELSSRGEQTLGPSHGASVSPHSDSDAEIRFTRTLKFMTEFIHRVKRDPRLMEPTSTASSPSSTSPNAGTDNIVEIPYQASVQGSSPIKYLKMSKRETFAMLCQRLRERTKFRGISLIHGGAKVDLSNRMDDSIESILGKGLLLVRNDHQNVMDEAPPLKSTRLTAAERAVITHLETLYALLDLDEHMSSSVYHFLMLFSPHERVRQMIHRDGITLDELFPTAHRAKSFYSVWCLNSILRQYTQSNSMSDAFIVKVVRLLSRTLTVSPLAPLPNQPLKDPNLTMKVVECLGNYLRERTVKEKMADHIENGAALAENLFTLLEEGLVAGCHVTEDDHEVTYRCLLEAAMHDDVLIWKAFRAFPRQEEVHLALLVEREPQGRRETFSNIIKNLCNPVSSPHGLASTEVAAFYWKTLSTLLPRIAKEHVRSQELLETLDSIFALHSTSLMDENTLRALLASWTSMLSNYRHFEIPGEARTDAFARGFLRLIAHCLSSVKSFKKPVVGRDLVELLLNAFLFPKLEGEDPDCPQGSAQIPILNTESRKQAYNIITNLFDDPASYEVLIKRIFLLIDCESKSSQPLSLSNVDRSRWLRSSVGFSGLRNLTNTCYMNSLMSQLFMNTDFRAFMMNAEANDSTTQDLVAETQKLFSHMQNASTRFADTTAFTYAIRPMDSEHIDITVQMDVDEFYLLLFDRWESALKTNEAKERFRSFYGGQLVGQIKSKDCEHVSETAQSFFTIGCEVRGKQDLQESLKSYIEADVMEGENKYKCESCGGRFVNAVKRSCLKELPDNLIFHLKRFDFDLTTLTRSKINDEFQFPETINMTPYTVDYINNPTPDAKPDVFQLVGVLVHSGAAETGHYYSYINVPPYADSTSDSWAEFNDAEVSEFDKGKIPDQCFGGQTFGGGNTFPKVYNAYMLFYKRVSAVEAEHRLSVGQDHPGRREHAVPSAIASKINTENKRQLRQYCLFDPSHAALIKRLLNDLKVRSGTECSDTHETEDQILHLALEHVALLYSREKDIPECKPMLETMQKHAANCVKCCKTMLSWIIANAGRSEDMLLASPYSALRLLWCQFIPPLLQCYREADLIGYCGLDSDVESCEPDAFNELLPLPDDSILKETVATFKDMLGIIGRYLRSWDDYFGLWHGIASLGVVEVAVLLSEDILLDALHVLRIDRNRRPSTNNLAYREIWEQICRNKRSPAGFGIVRLLSKFLEHVDPSMHWQTSTKSRNRNYDNERERFPLTFQEHHLVREVLDNRDSPLMCLARVVDCWEDIDHHPFYPAEIMKELVICTRPPESDELDDENEHVDIDLERALANTMVEFVRDYELPWIKTPLHMAFAFCTQCSDKAYVVEILKMTAETARVGFFESGPPRTGLPQYSPDYENTGGKEILQFFTELSTCHNSFFRSDPQTKPDDEFFLIWVLNLIHSWAPGPLLFDERSARVSTAHALRVLLFDHYPTHLSVPEDGGPEDITGVSSTLDKIRIVAVRKLYKECRRFVARAEQLNLPRRIVSPLGDVLALCVEWCHKLDHEDSGPLAALKTPRDTTITNEFEAMRDAMDRWGNTFEEPSAVEAEWESGDGDSDILTEPPTEVGV